MQTAGKGNGYSINDVMVETTYSKLAAGSVYVFIHIIVIDCNSVAWTLINMVADNLP